MEGLGRVTVHMPGVGHQDVAVATAATATSSSLSHDSSRDTADRTDRTASMALEQGGDQEAHEASLAGGRVEITFGSVDFKRAVDLSKEHKIVIKVDKAFQSMKQVVFERLVAQGKIAGTDANDFKMTFNHNRQITQWWIARQGASIMGEYDHHSDRELSEASRKVIQDAHEEILSAAHPVTKIGVSQMQTVIPRCLGPMGRTNLGRHFNQYDHVLFAGGLAHQKGTEAQKREQAFGEYMEREFLKVEERPGVRGAKDVSKDLGSVMIYHQEMIKAIDAKHAALKHELATALDASAGIETAETRAIPRKMAELDHLKERIHDMHMNPLFVSKTYAPPDAIAEPNPYKRVATLKGQISGHHELVNAGRSRFEGAKRFFKREGAPEPKRFEDLAFLISAKEVFRGDRPGFVQYCHVNQKFEGQSLGPEEYLFDRLLDQRAGYAYEPLAAFDQLDVDLRDTLNGAMGTAKGKVEIYRARLERYHGGAQVRTSQETIAQARALLRENLA